MPFHKNKHNNTIILLIIQALSARPSTFFRSSATLTTKYLSATYRRKEVNPTMKIVVIRHFGVPFHNNETAVLLATGVTHHIVRIKD